jgi:hypothetical protein
LQILAISMWASPILPFSNSGALVPHGLGQLADSQLILVFLEQEGELPLIWISLTHRELRSSTVGISLRQWWDSRHRRLQGSWLLHSLRVAGLCIRRRTAVRL